MVAEGFLFQALFLFSGAPEAVFCEAGIAQGAADSLEFSEQFAETWIVASEAGLFEILLHFLLTAAQMNPAQGSDCGFQHFGCELFVLLQQDQGQHAAIAFCGRNFKYIGRLSVQR